MKKFIALTALLGSMALANAQKCEIPLTIAPSLEGDVVPMAVNSRLDNKLRTIASRCGVAGMEGSQFFLTGRFDTGFSERTSGPTPAEYVNTTLTLYMGDAEGKKIFSSLTLDLKGAGASVEQAYTKAINSINVNNPDFQRFVEQGKEKILDYYNSNYPKILTKAQSAMKSRNYDEALYYASTIPECCTGFAEAQKIINASYVDQRNYESQNALTAAKAAWAADPTDAGAAEAFKAIQKIDPSSPAYAEAMKLGEQMKAKVQENWYFENVQKYKDEMELRKQREANRTALERDRLKAARDVAKAYAAAAAKRTVVYNYHRWY